MFGCLFGSFDTRSQSHYVVPAGLELCLPSADTTPILSFKIKCFKKTGMVITLMINIQYAPPKLKIKKIRGKKLQKNNKMLKLFFKCPQNFQFKEMGES